MEEISPSRLYGWMPQPSDVPAKGTTTSPGAVSNAVDPSLIEGGSIDEWLELVVRDNYRGLYTYAHSLTRNAADAADLTQQTTVILTTRWQDIRDRSKVKSWLYSCLYREFLRMKRKNSRMVAIDETNTNHEPSFPAPQEKSTDGQSAVDALHSLPEPHRSVLALYYLDELSYREIATVLDLPAGTVMSRLSRAKDAIRRILRPAS